MSFFKKKSFESVKETYKTSALSKNLTLIDLILLGLGGIIGTGVFAFTGLVAAKYAGPAVILSYGIAGFVCIFVALAYTELATMLPTSGSVYTYSYVAFGEVIAWLVGSLIIVELGFAIGAVAGSLSAYLQALLTSAGMGLPEYLLRTPFEGGIINLPAITVIFLIGFMLYRGTKESKTVNTVLVFVKIAAIFIFVFLAAPHFDAANWENFMPYGFNGVTHGASILFFAYTGFGTLASTAEECKNPKRDLTIGIIGSLLIASTIYMVVAATLTGIVPFEELGNAQPLAYGLQLIGNNFGSALVSTGAIAGMTTVIMINAYGMSRIFYVIARDGLLSNKLTKLHNKYNSPYYTISIFTIITGLLGGFVPVSLLGEISSMGAITDYIIITLIVILFRIKYPNAERAFKCPAIFVIAPVALLSSLYLLSQQIVQNGEILITGKIFMCWFIIMFILYCMKVSIFKKKLQ